MEVLAELHATIISRCLLQKSDETEPLGIPLWQRSIAIFGDD